MDLKFTPNKISINTAGATTAILKAAEAYMNQTSDKLIEIMKIQIDTNGNGSKIMRSDAIRAVREISREVAEDHITIEAGFDEAMAASMAKDFYVRTMVVIHGNQAGGPIHTKPGQSTWKKHVIGYGMSGAKSVYDIPQFNQNDVSKKIVDNTMKEVKKYFKEMLDALCKIIPGIIASYFGGG